MRIRERHYGCRLDVVERRGHTYLAVENELVRVSFVLTKGADLVEFRHKPTDVDAMWHSPHRLSRPGTQIHTIASMNGAFLDYYSGGWQEILPAGAGPCTYKNAELGLHGEAALLPWDAAVLEDAPERVTVRFSVEMRRTPFVLERTVTVDEGRMTIGWHGRVINEGEQELGFMWGQHAAFGWPFIEAGCHIDLPSAVATTLSEPYSRGMRFALNQESAWPELKTVDGGTARADLVPGKDARTHDTYTVSPDEGWFAIRNLHRGLGFAMVWDVDIYPYLWVWQVYGGYWDYPFFGRAYVLGLEPFSSPQGSLIENVETGRCHALPAGASMEVDLRAGFFLGSERSVRGVDPDGTVHR